ncbi:1-acyl-sn-glycerol-3-phosphate acyltransferase [Butyrivibrio sp. CB08]|uniref:lysophospholipid acyltransferase family protein n=1 Tax=Butyrivibrio sp. CB08 TaxID=2364879 RepID=UPI000EA90872|nr:lysophospholipid acyltransferase family protein [Butyrivibrio sp. CB08]RKM55965.1 1-acyl-sn-glycerol-3-phosphate acyltransferase [Butyrivibrio sp. CB08]
MNPRFYKGYDRFYKFTKRFICPFLAKRAHFTGEKLPTGIGPRFILCNHNTDFDFLLLTSKSDESIDFVVTETMLRMNRFFNLVVKVLKPILHDKGSTGAATIKQMVGRIKEGRSILLFPEGNRSFDGRTGDVSDAIGKIAKMTGASLVVYRLTGGYFTTPRWGSKIRKGSMEGKVIRVIEAKELKSMQPDEVKKIIVEGLYTDAYKEQEERNVRFESKAPAEYLESLLFICPSCKKIGALSSKIDKLSCSCGYQLTMDEYGYLTGDKGDKHSITELFDEQKKLLEARLEGPKEDMLWSDNVKMMKLSTGHEVLKEEDCTLLAYPDCLKAGDSSFPKESITSIDIVQRNRLTLHIKGESGHLEFTGDDTFNAVKYQLWFETACP